MSRCDWHRELRIDWIGLNPSLAMRTLGRNLAIAGALCTAYEQGAERNGGAGFFPGHVYDEEALARRLGFEP